MKKLTSLLVALVLIFLFLSIPGVIDLKNDKATDTSTAVLGEQVAQEVQKLKDSTVFVGERGTDGAQGSNGANGTQGPQGIQGVQGIVGSQGLQGTQGVPGERGEQGNTGATGAQGVQGIQGEKGFLPALREKIRGIPARLRGGLQERLHGARFGFGEQQCCDSGIF